MSDIVTTHQLSKRYGDRQVVHDVDLRIPEGVVYGFLGPNGAGKSTTMKMLLSLIRPSSGSIRILGEPMTRENRHRLLGRIGSLIESPPGYGHLTGAENMRIVQHLLGLNDDDGGEAVGNDLFEQVEGAGHLGGFGIAVEEFALASVEALDFFGVGVAIPSATGEEAEGAEGRAAFVEIDFFGADVESGFVADLRPCFGR